MEPTGFVGGLRPRVFSSVSPSSRSFCLRWPEFCVASSREPANAPKRDNLRRPSMNANRSERLRRRKEFEANQSHLRANQIETMIAEFDRMCIDLGLQIEAEDKRDQIDDPT